MNIILTMLSLKLKSLKSYEKHILTTLCIRADEKTFECWPSLKCLREDTGLDEKTVQAAILSLLKQNIIIRTGEMKGKTKRTPVYKVVFNTPVNGCVQNLNTPVYPGSDPVNGAAKRSRLRGMEGYSLKDTKKDDFAHANLSPKTKEQRKKEFSNSSGPKALKNIYAELGVKS